MVVKSLQLPEVRTAILVSDDSSDSPLAERVFYKRERPPPPPPRRISLLKYEDNAS